MSKLAKALTAAAGNAGESLYVEDVFSTYLYDGTGAAQTITNGIDLDGEGGLVWMKARDNSGTYGRNVLMDTERVNGSNDYILYTDGTEAQAGGTADLTTYNSDGFRINAGYSGWNDASYDYASWTFRKAEKFFDVVTYTGNGVAGRTVAHNLGSAPACMIIKRTDSVKDWTVYHSGLNGGSSPQSYSIYLNLTDAQGGFGAAIWNSTTPSDSVFTLGSSDFVNGSGGTYVAYLFASDAGGFGDDDESIIKCGSYTGTGSAGLEVDLGFEPQWVLVKSTTSSSGNWLLMDVMRGMHNTGGAALFPNQSYAEGNLSAYTSGYIVPTSTGFVINAVNNVNVNQNSGNYIYIAIRRPMKTPESGTEVFTPTSGTSSGFNFIAGFPVDMAIIKDRDGVVTPYASARLTSGTLLSTASTAAEFANAPAVFDSQVGYYEGSLDSTYIGWMFKRATGFFDVVAYSGTGATGLQINHNLGVVPEMIIVKARSGAYNWQWVVYHKDLSEHDSGTWIASKNLILNTNSGETNNYVFSQHSDQTDTVFTLGYSNSAMAYASGYNYIAYLFATLAGVSKVGSYTGTGSNVDVDCGFSAGARFILIKRSDSTGDWYVWDSERGIVAGNDPYLLLNSTVAEVTSTDYIDPLSSGFTVTSSAPAALNASGGNYIFLAIA